MTTYAYDTATTNLLAIWESGVGSTARSVARLHPRTAERAGLHLARALTVLSTTAWLGYSDPDLLDVDAPAALRALRRPHLPRAGLLYREGDPVLDAAHDVGRELATLGSAGVTRAVVADVTDELDAIARAVWGDLSGRARQAVTLTRLDASPAQIAAADRLLHEVPMGSERLFTEVEPTAAAVAAAHWLLAAVDVTLAVAEGDDPIAVLHKAADIEQFDTMAPGVVLTLMGAGNPPLAVVQNLVRSAMLAARGMILPGVAEPTDDPADESRFTVLDPMRPARCLLERLTRAVQTCSLVYAEHCDPSAVAGESGDRDWMELTRDRFDAAVRVEAERTAERLFRTAPPTLAS